MWSALALGALTLISASPAPSAPQNFPCNQHTCTASVTTTPSFFCTVNPTCGSIGIGVFFQTTNGLCTTVGGSCSGNCSYQVTLTYNNPNSSCTAVDVVGTECGNAVSFLNNGLCLPPPGPCTLSVNNYRLLCGHSCNFSYTVSDQSQPSVNCNVSGSLICGSTCP